MVVQSETQPEDKPRFAEILRVPKGKYALGASDYYPALVREILRYVSGNRSEEDYIVDNARVEAIVTVGLMSHFLDFFRQKR